MTANEKQARKWVKAARERASLAMGVAWPLFSEELRRALAASALVDTLAAQDEGNRNADTFVRACELVRDDEE